MTDEKGELNILPFDQCIATLHKKIDLALADIGTNKRPIMFLTMDDFILKERNRKNEMWGLPLEERLPNFRNAIAKTREYKGNRKDSQKPFHFNNLAAYMLANFDCVVANGLEADDEMAIRQCEKPDITIICSRDKDLRQVPGWHYSWECGKMGAIGPVHTDEIGWLEKVEKGNHSAKGDFKVRGYGLAFFYYQMLTGDVVDNIPGLPKYGQVKAYKIVDDVLQDWVGKFDATTKEKHSSLYNTVGEEYQKVYGDEWEEKFMEQAQLLWLVRKLDKDGQPIMYKKPE